MSYGHEHSFNTSKKDIRLSIARLNGEWLEVTNSPLVQYGTLPSNNWLLEGYFANQCVLAGQEFVMDCFENDASVPAMKTLCSIVDKQGEQQGFNSRQMPEIIYNQILSGSLIPFSKEAIRYWAKRDFEITKSETPAFYYADFCGAVTSRFLSQLHRLKKGDLLAFTFNSYARAGQDKCPIDFKGMTSRERLRSQIEEVRSRLVKSGKKPHLVREFIYNNGSKSKMATIAFSLGETPTTTFEGFDTLTESEKTRAKKTDSKEYRLKMVYDAFNIWPNNDNGGLVGQGIGGLRAMITNVKKEGIDLKKMDIKKALEWVSAAPND